MTVVVVVVVYMRMQITYMRMQMTFRIQYAVTYLRIQITECGVQSTDYAIRTTYRLCFLYKEVSDLYSLWWLYQGGDAVKDTDYRVRRAPEYKVHIFGY